MNRRIALSAVASFAATLCVGLVIGMFFGDHRGFTAVPLIRPDTAVTDCVPVETGLKYRRLPLAEEGFAESEQLTVRRKPDSGKSPLANDERAVPESAKRFGARAYVLVHRERCGVKFGF